MRTSDLSRPCLALAALALACSGGEGSSESATETASTTVASVSVTATTTNGSASATGSTTASETEGGSESATGTSTTTSASDTATTSTTDPTSSTSDSTGDSTSTTGPNPVCSPGETQCNSETAYETCADDGLSWADPVQCDAKQVCSSGACVTLCQKAADELSSIGCEYYGVDANNDPAENYDVQPYAIVVSNVDAVYTAEVQIQVHDGNQWTMLQQATVGPKMLHQFDVPDRHVNYTNINPRGAYKIVSDVPLIAYQFQPVNGQSSFTSDASLLLPRNTLDQYYYVLGWGEPSYGAAQVNIVASEDDTHVKITPTTNVQAGGGIPALSSGQEVDLPVLNEADVIQLDSPSGEFSGSYITSDKPIAVFSTHWCANVPSQGCCCDHLEEQVYGLQTWGTTYVGSRWPVRSANTPEPSYWHLFAAEDNTQVHIDAHAEVSGIANKDFTMGAGELIELAVGGTMANPGDFFISADKPVYVMQYLSSSFTVSGVGTDKSGDPAMAQAVPVEQFRDDYVVLVPANWLYDFMVITKKVGSTVNLDGAAIDQNVFTVVGPADDQTEWEVGRISVADGVHTLDGDQAFGVIVLGYDSYDSYAYPGGLDQKQINPQ
ncbi:MAG: IgGFc-binding protein [Nannocystaceae bacterium]